MTTHKTIKVSVAKGHLLTLGEQLYTESIELVRELVHNAYDADATDVYVTITPDQIVVEDNGSGMNEHGLTQFFTVGSDEKRKNKLSPRFGRARIGQFGIGKFAALAVAKQFTVETRKGDWVYRVTFDRDVWQEQETWELPIVREPATPLHQEGTRVTLSKLTKSFSVRDVERFLKDAVPLRAKKFAVFLNQKRITAGFTPGRHIPIHIKTMYGAIDGEITVAIHARYVDHQGIECRVKQALITRECFGIEGKHTVGLSRITGSVNADWLPITANRTEFIRDSNEYKLFFQLMRAQLDAVLATLKDDEGKKRLKKVTEELQRALGQIRNALRMHPELTPSGRAIAARRKRKGAMVASTLTEAERLEKDVSAATSDVSHTATTSNDTSRQREPAKKQVVEREIPKPQVLKKIRVHQLGISVGVTSLGADGPEAYSDGNTVYINQDHPLYKTFYKKSELFSLHLLRLITQEVVLMKRLRIPAGEAFAIQSKLLTDAITSDQKTPNGEHTENNTENGSL